MKRSMHDVSKRIFLRSCIGGILVYSWVGLGRVSVVTSDRSGWGLFENCALQSLESQNWRERPWSIRSVPPQFPHTSYWCHVGSWFVRRKMERRHFHCHIVSFWSTKQWILSTMYYFTHSKTFSEKKNVHKQQTSSPTALSLSLSLSLKIP